MTVRSGTPAGRRALSTGRWTAATGWITAALLLGGPAAAPAQEGEAWTYRVAPYLWLSGVDGRVATLPGLPPTEVDFSSGGFLYDVEMTGPVLGFVFRF